MKFDWLITFRSVTFAQRGEMALRKVGIDCLLRRTPRELSTRGCGYCVALRESDAVAAVELLKEREIPYGKLYARNSAGKMEERTL